MSSLHGPARRPSAAAMGRACPIRLALPVLPALAVVLLLALALAVPAARRRRRRRRAGGAAAAGRGRRRGRPGPGLRNGRRRLACAHRAAGRTDLRAARHAGAGGVRHLVGARPRRPGRGAGGAAAQVHAAVVPVQPDLPVPAVGARHHPRLRGGRPERHRHHRRQPVAAARPGHHHRLQPAARRRQRRLSHRSHRQHRGLGDGAAGGPGLRRHRGADLHDAGRNLHRAHRRGAVPGLRQLPRHRALAEATCCTPSRPASGSTCCTCWPASAPLCRGSGWCSA